MRRQQEENHYEEKEEKKENIVNICQHTNSPFIVSVTKINPMYKRKLIKKDNRRYLL